MRRTQQAADHPQIYIPVGPDVNWWGDVISSPKNTVVAFAFVFV